MSETNATYLGGHRMLVHTYYRTLCYCDTRDNVITPKLIAHRFWEKYISNYLVETLTPDTYFVDVGAHIGYLSSLAAVYIGSKGMGKVMAFEPSPELFAYLQSNLQSNGATCPWEAFPHAIGEKEGNVQFFTDPERSAHGSLHPHSGAEAITVQCRPLDEAIPAADHSRIDYVKIDVEGHEFGVLKGMSHILESNDHLKVIMEWSPRQLRDAGCDTTELVQWLSRHFSQAYIFRRELTPLTFKELPTLGLADLLLER